MFSKKEDAVMQIVYTEGIKRKSFLISPADIKAMSKNPITEKEIDKILCDLKKDGYFDFIYSDRHGESVYCITLSEKGKGYARDKMVTRRNLIYRLILTIGFAIISFVIGIILRLVF